MKIITIGRDSDCDIMIDDPIVSRRHALLKLFPSGKVEIVDMSSNGTYVNGMKLKNNVPTPVSRKDIISLAHVKQLDWKQVPDLTKPYKLAALIVAGIIALSLAVWGVMAVINHYSSSNEEVEEVQGGGVYDPRVQDKDKVKEENTNNSRENEKIKSFDFRKENRTVEPNVETKSVSNHTQATKQTSQQEQRPVKQVTLAPEKKSTTTQPPAPTTEKKSTTTQPPAPTTEKKSTTTQPPTPTTEKKSTTTQPPTPTTEKKSTTTQPQGGGAMGTR